MVVFVSSFIFRFVVYFSFLCVDPAQGKLLLHATVKALASLLASENPQDSSSSLNERSETPEPCILWSALYIQELIMVLFMLYIVAENFFSVFHHIKVLVATFRHLVYKIQIQLEIWKLLWIGLFSLFE